MIYSASAVKCIINFLNNNRVDLIKVISKAIILNQSTLILGGTKMVSKYWDGIKWKHFISKIKFV